MLELYFSHPARLKQMRNPPLGAHLDALATRLHTEGYRPVSTRALLSHASDFNRMLGWRGLEAQDITPVLVDEYLTRRGRETRCRGLRNALDHLTRQLRLDGVMADPPPDKTPDQPFAELLARYANWMARVQGLAQSTIEERVKGGRRFLLWWRGAHPDEDLQALAGCDVLTYITQAQLSGTQVSDLRQLFRYLHGVGVTNDDLSKGIPSVRRVHLARAPKHISWEDVGRLLKAADGEDPVGLRDRAVVMLSAQLGLRNVEIRHLRLDDIDWRHAIVRIVESKGGKSRELPLPAATGEALAEYIRSGRPCAQRREVFLRHRAPGGVLTTGNSVSNIIRRLAKRAGVLLPENGQNLLRHSLATYLVNHEVSIKAISDLLGHASIDTTAIYTLVDMTTLARVAQPFPGERAP
jgi:integrase/recombinase XerD